MQFVEVFLRVNRQRYMIENKSRRELLSHLHYYVCTYVCMYVCTYVRTLDSLTQLSNFRSAFSILNAKHLNAVLQFVKFIFILN